MICVRRSLLLVMALALTSTSALGGVYRVVSTQAEVRPNQTVALSVEFQSEEGDNVIGRGLFSFAIDLAVGGNAGLSADHLGNVRINELAFNDTAHNFTGTPVGNNYLNTAGVTTDLFAPNAGAIPGEVVQLFQIDLSVPATTPIGSVITLTPSEGFLENLVLNDSFDNVYIQRFEPGTLTVTVPEPATGLFVFVAIAMGATVRPRCARVISGL